ncbi:hypothetical protein [Filimonas effusa]|uniref:Uncharacterized protein n=1 Tax=Filimonas effusa TaxID=2508721 RepID=A0A4Q1D6I8_9BACT|nr:hypothetical protein [Filimonas effusa]RXK83493.1 hypothetical protein ESB13_15485 [Filimonas effusa]
MKTQFNVIAVVCTLLILATSCKKEKQGIQLTQNAITDKIPVEVKEYFASIGFDSATLALQNGKYVIEGDMLFRLYTQLSYSNCKASFLVRQLL